jgi:hypothetical protein
MGDRCGPTWDKRGTGLFFWSFAGTAAFIRDPAILSGGLTRCVVRLQEEPSLERELERRAKIIKIEKSAPISTGAYPDVGPDGGIKPHPVSSNK